MAINILSTRCSSAPKASAAATPEADKSTATAAATNEQGGTVQDIFEHGVAWDLPIIPKYDGTPNPVYANEPVDAAPAQWAPTPAAHNNGDGLKGKLLDAFESGIDKLVHTELYKPTKTTAPKLTEAQREEFKSKLQPGDIILESDDSIGGWRVFEGTLGGSGKWQHAAIYAGEGVIIEAGGKIQENVHRVTVDDFLDTNHVALLRPSYRDPAAAKAAVDYAITQLGKPYDGRFNFSDDAMYCSELAAKALEAGGVSVPTTPRAVDSAPTVPPDSLLKVPGMTVEYMSDDNTFWKGVESNIGGLLSGLAERKTDG